MSSPLDREFRWWVEGELTRLACHRLARGESRADVLVALLEQNDAYGSVVDRITVERIVATALPSLQEVREAGPHSTDTWLEWMNQWHFVAPEAGHTTVFTEFFDPDFMRHLLARSSFTDIRNLYGHILLRTGQGPDGERFDPLGKVWLEWSRRRQYRGVIFSPGRDRVGYYNRWRGFDVKPQPGAWQLFHHHITDNICRGHVERAEWLLAWMAMAVQRPDRQGDVAVVLRGKRGTGKGVMARGFGGLFGEHFIHLVNVRHLAGHFNAHLEDAVVVFADEVAWRADKQAEGMLKMLITEPTIPIERKGRDVYASPNRTHIIIASNERWAVPSGPGERRFFVLDVGEAAIQDHQFFGAIDEELRSGGRAALLHDLLGLDVSGINLRRPLVTEALQEQQLYSMEPGERWWHRKLVDGQLVAEHDGWVTEIPRSRLEGDYAEALNRERRPSHSVATELGMLLRRLLPGGALRSFRRNEGGRSIRYWEFPALADCREHFSREMGQEFVWLA